MAWQSVRIETREDVAEQLGDGLLDSGALSASIEDAHAGTAREQPIFGEPGEPEAGLWPECVVVALFPEDADVPAILASATTRLGLPSLPAFTVETLEEEDWVRKTQSQFDPIRISGKLWIVPSWHDAPDPSAVNLVLDPGLAFGTGSHPTTRLCLQWLENHIAGGEYVMDYGCGSGILAIAAMRLGAGSAVGIDVDPQAIAASKANAAQNAVEAAFYLPGAAPRGQADVLVANILTNPLKLLAPALSQAVRPGGTIALSGILEEQADEVLDVYRAWFTMAKDGSDEGWVRLAGTRRDRP